MKWEAEVYKLLPSSVVRRFEVRCKTVAEATVVVNVARHVAGSVGAVLAALYCYITPVQVAEIDIVELVNLYTGVSVFSGDTLSAESVKSKKNAESRERGSNVAGAGSTYLGVPNPQPPEKKAALSSQNNGWSDQATNGGKRESNRISKRARKTVPVAKSTVLRETRFSPGSVVGRTDEVFGASGDSPVVYRWEADAHGQQERMGLQGSRHDAEQVVRINSCWRKVVRSLERQLLEAADEGNVTHLLKKFRNVSSIEACTELAELPSREAKGASLIRALNCVESLATKSLIMLDLMERELVSDTDIAEVKGHIGAVTKVNVKLCKVLQSAKRYFAQEWEHLAVAATAFFGMANDQFSAWVMWFTIAAQVDRDLALRMAACANDVPMLKELSTTIKSLGLNSTQKGALLCELNTLQGRGAVPGVADDDVSFRINRKQFYSEKAACLDPVALRKNVREVLAEEMASAPKWMDPDDYWSRRWMFTKSGSHTRHIEDVVLGHRLDLPEQPTRREFAESIKENLVAHGAAEVFAGLSWKLENGKTRAIYGCDSRSYFTFDYLLRPLEAVWRNKSALLNPGLNLQSSLYPFLAKLGPFYYMLDFDDYNSQHTLEAMKIVIEEATRGAPEAVRQWAINSWDNMFVRWVSTSSGKLEKRRMIGTLPSGHRATTFVNTVLNAAYCRTVIGEDYKLLGCLHAGDDVIMWGGAAPLSNAIARVEASPLRVNRSKQSIGNVSGEFLRVAFNRKEAYGYLGRAISGCVSGSWVTEAAVSPRSYLENFARMGWTIANRSRVRNAGALLVHSLVERTGFSVSEAHSICTNRVSLGGTPVMDNEPNNWIKFELKGGNPTFGRVDAGSNSYATDAYLSNHIDVKLLRAAGVNMGSLKALMLKASYKPRGDPKIKTMSVTKLYCPPTVALGIVTAVHFKQRETTTSTALSLLENLMSGVDWRYFAAKIRGTDASFQSVTGKSEWPVGSPMGVPYSDNMSLRDRFSQPMLMRPLFRVYA